MNPARLLDQFGRISEAPDAVPRLRRFILDLAVRGKLVEQDPRDEPAEQLLQRIQAEKARLVKSGAARAPKPIQLVSDDDLPFAIPVNWSWSQLAEVGFISPRNSAADDLLASFVPMPLISAEYGVATRHEVRPWAEIKGGFTHFAEGDVALAKITPCFENGKSTAFSGLTGGIGAGTTELHVVRPVLVSADYVLLFLKSAHFIESGVPCMTGTAGQKRVPTDYFAHSPFPLPPIAEQRRIVAKVDELMALCDRLEAAQSERERRRDRLVASSLDRLNQPADDQSFCEGVRFHLDHLPRLTTRADQLGALRRTILGLAVHGKLVAQDSSDGLVGDQLAVSDRAREATARQDRRADDGLQTLLATDQRWDIPGTWEWRAVADLVLFIDYRGQTPAKTESGVRLITAKNVKRGFINQQPEEFLSETTYPKWMTRGIPNVGDVLFTTEAPIGNAAVVRLTERFALAQRVICFRSYGALNPDFLVLQLLAEPFRAILERTATGLTAKGIKAAKLKRLPVVVPPLAEQLRIVARVNELMALCDRLESELKAAHTELRRLLDALLHEALATDQPEAEDRIPLLLPFARIEGAKRSRLSHFREGLDEAASVPCVGRIAAGVLTLAEQHVECWFHIPTSMARPVDGAWCVLRVKGDSMNLATIDGGRIEDGDFLLVRRQSAPEFGKVVVAEYEGDDVLKRYVNGGTGPVLRAESTGHYPDIPVEEGFRIQGIVRANLKSALEFQRTDTESA